MKLIYLSNSRFPSNRAQSTQMVQSCNAFAAIGYTVKFMVTNRPSPITDSPAEYYGQPLQFSYQTVAVPDIAGRSDYIPRFLHGLALALQQFYFAWRVHRSGELAADAVIYSRDEWILYFLSFWRSTDGMVYESHQAKYNRSVRRLVRLGVPVVVISEGIRDYYLAAGVPGGQLLVAHDAVDDSFFAPLQSQAQARNHLQLDTAKPVVMYIGGLEDWKGADIFCVAAETDASYETVVVGGTPEAIAEYQTRYPAVRFLGSTPYRDLPLVQQAADILVIPNTGKSELGSTYTSPLKAFTYMTSGIPLIVSQVPSLRAIFAEKEVTWFQPDDAKALQAAIITTLENIEVKRQIAQQLQLRSKGHTWVARAESIKAFITARLEV